MNKSSDSKFTPALGYHWLTRYYDIVVGTTLRERKIKQALINQANFKPGEEILDLACGTGTLTIWIKQHHPKVKITGIDADRSVLSLADKKAINANVSVNFEQSMSNNLPFSTDYFDKVVSSLFFHHLTWDDKKATALQLYRVLKPGGQLHIADWGKANNLLMRGLFLFIQVLDGFRNTQDNVNGKLINLFEEAGFNEVVERQTFNTIFGTMVLYSAIKPKT